MNYDKNDKNINSGSLPESEFILLVYAHLGKSLDTRGAAVLKQYLKDPYYVARFVEICKQDRLIYEMFSAGLPRTIKEPDSMDFAAWNEMAKYEECAPVLKLENAEPQCELIQKVQREKIRFNLKRSSLFTLVTAVAAVILIFVFARLAPPASGLKVAVLSDSINAKWIDIDSKMDKGTPVLAGRKSFVLQEGCVKLLFDNDTQVTIEGPAAFQVRTEDQIKLRYGRLYAIVPRGAIGFSVYTENAKIIDLGTEFGIEVAAGGDTYLHVIKGRTTLIAGEKFDKVSMEIGAGQAKRVSGITQIISDVTFQENLFVRNIDSIKNTIWKGQTGIDLAEIDLADIVRNGNGLGTGNSQVRLNYTKGFTTDLRGGETLIAKDFLPIKDHPFIDGIFIPDERTVVSSRGDVFEEFLRTSGVHCADLFGNPVPGSFFLNEQQHTIQFDGQEYSERGKSCIFMPGSNHGITFDLNAIRDCYNLKIDRFTSRVGLADFDNKRCNANFYVLVDGQLRYSLLGYTQKGVLNDVSVKLEDTDRFLTLATTENVDQRDYMVYSTLHDNWCVFTEPVLILE